MHDHYWVIKAGRGQSIGFERADEPHAVQCLVGDIPTVWIQDRGALRLRLGFTTFDASAPVPLLKKRALGHPRLFRSTGSLLSHSPSSWSVGAAETNFEHLNLAARRPVIQPTSFPLRVNLKAAKAFGLSIPESFPLLADEVIE